MFLHVKTRNKDGQEHRYRVIVETQRVVGNRRGQRQVLHLGEIDDGQRKAWCQTIEVLQEGQPCPVQVALFPEDHEVPALDCQVVHCALANCSCSAPGSGAPAS